MGSKYVDVTAIMQVIGCVFNNPSLLDQTDKYSITDDDFPDKFHKVAFGAIYNIFNLGATKISIKNILDFLAQHPKSEAVFKKEKGEEWLLQVAENATSTAFEYYYNRLKKMTLLRAFDNRGVDVSFLYDPDNILDTKKKEIQEEWLDNTSLAAIAQKVTERLEDVVSIYVNETFGDVRRPGEGALELRAKLKEHPDVGVPLYGPLINTVTRGARLRKLYLRSAPSGYGKTRTMVADTCFIGCDMIYDDMFGWIKNGTAEPVLYITTEQELEEIQTMMWAFISGVDEDHIMNNTFVGDEEERVDKAIEILDKSKIYIVELPDFSLRDVEDIIKRNIRENGVKYVIFDYIMTSLKILEEIAGRAGGVKLREDNILFMLSRRLKDIANEYGVFILSGTQLNADWKEADSPDQNLLRGAKSIADSIDWGGHILPATTKDLEGLETILSSNTFDKPNIKLSVYKNRRGRYKGVYLWMKADYGTCRFKSMFATTWDYEIIPIEDLKIITEEAGAF
jgi:replicative DNA helicase